MNSETEWNIAKLHLDSVFFSQVSEVQQNLSQRAWKTSWQEMTEFSYRLMVFSTRNARSPHFQGELTAFSFMASRGLIIISVIWDYRVVWCDWGSPKSQRRSQDLVHLCTGDGVCDVKGAHYLAGGCLGNARANSGLRPVPGLLHVGCTFCVFFSLPDPVWPPACVQLVAVHPGWGWGRGEQAAAVNERGAFTSWYQDSQQHHQLEK